MKTPGVYILEKDAFPNSVVEVATAVPAFIGYTQKADNGGKSLLNKPFRITSFSEYLQYFGGPPQYKFQLSKVTDGSAADISIRGTDYHLVRQGTVFRLFDAMKFFFQNGGGPCYIVSIGYYGNGTDPVNKGLLDGTDRWVAAGAAVVVAVVLGFAGWALLAPAVVAAADGIRRIRVARVRNRLLMPC